MSKISKRIKAIYVRGNVRELVKQGIAVSAIAKKLGISYAHAKNLCTQEAEAAHGIGVGDER